MNVELIYDQTCPNVEGARQALLRAFAQIGRTPRWVEWERSASDSPSYVRAYGSPTILIDGEDVSPASVEPGGDSCRLYTDTSGSLLRAPSVECIVSGMTHKTRRSRRFGFGGLFAAVPAGGAVLLPVGTCPACWPAYAAFLGSLGLGFLLSERALLPLATAFILIVLATLAYRASTRRGFGPFALGTVGASSALLGKFVIFFEPAVYLGIAILCAATVWNAWPRQNTTSYTSCKSDPIPSPKEHSQ